MKYYKLIYDFENDDDYVILKSNSEIDYYDKKISNGEYISNWDETFTFVYNEDEGEILTDYLAANNGWIVVSDKFCDIMCELFGSDVQLLNVIVSNENTKEKYKRYKVLNVIKHLNALDLDNSIFDLFEIDNEKILSVEKYVLKEAVVNSNHIFKLCDETVPVFVSEKVKQLIEINHLKGFEFLEVKTV